MEERDKDIITQNPAEDEIDLIEIAAKLWTNRKFIIKTTLIFMAIGLFVAIFTPNEYTATTTMVPQTGDKKVGGSLGGLAAMAGINLGSMSSGEVLSPNVYPQILNNVNFQKELLYTRYSFKKANEPVTYFEYYTNRKYSSLNILGFIKKYTIGLPGVIIDILKGTQKEEAPTESLTSDIQKLRFDESKIIKRLFNDLSLKIYPKEGYVILSFTSEEPKLSAEVVQTSQRLLQEFITDFKLQKVKSNLVFIEDSYNEAKKNFEDKQAELANFRDRNVSLSSAMAKTQEEKLTSEYNLLLSIYSELAKQREQAKISVTETTPILTVIEPVVIPNEKSRPSRSIILLGFTFFGLITGVGLVHSHQKIKDFVKKMNS